MRELIWIALAGALGAVCRYGLSGLTHRLAGESFPFGTLAVNLVGCLALGLVMQIGLASDVIPRMVRVAVGIGFLGSLTTFSTFGYETMALLEDGQKWLALANVLANVALGVLATWAGLGLGRLVLGGA